MTRPFCGAEEEIRPFLLEQDQRYTQQQICMGGRLVQRNQKILLHAADTVEHGIPMGKKSIAGLFQRPATRQVVVERLAVLRVLFPVVGGKPLHILGVRSCDTVHILPLWKRSSRISSSASCAVR